MSLLCIIPARAGSKGIPNKNLKFIGEKPLIQYTFETVSNIKEIDRIILTTDSQEIIDLAKKFPRIEVPFIRPEIHSQDITPMVEVLKHCIENIKDQKKYDRILLLQPTSPFRQETQIREAISKYNNSKADTLVSVVKSEKHISWSFWLKEDQLFPILDTKRPTRRQELEKMVSLNGAIYLTKKKMIIEENKIFGQKIIPFLMDRLSSLDIDEPLDLFITEMINNNWKDWYAKYQNQ
ncbi:MAG: acylneuraminate cytidylyltransferase family protein [Candidatus Ranarchaeia archaeon]